MNRYICYDVGEIWTEARSLRPHRTTPFREYISTIGQNHPDRSKNETFRSAVKIWRYVPMEERQKMENRIRVEAEYINGASWY